MLLCLIHRAQIQARDDLAKMFLKRIARFHVQAQQELELIRARHRALTEELIDTLADMLRVVEANPSDAELGRQVKSTLARHGDLAALSDPPAPRWQTCAGIGEPEALGIRGLAQEAADNNLILAGIDSRHSRHSLTVWRERFSAFSVALHGADS